MLNVLVVSPTGDKLEFSDVSFIKAKSSRGDIGILPKHINYVTALGDGELLIRFSKNEEKIYLVSGGFLEIQNDNVTIIAEDIIEAEKENIIRLQREQAIKKATEEKLREDRDILGTKKKIQDSLRR